MHWEQIGTNSFMTEISIRNQSIDLRSKSMYWFLYGSDLCHESVKFLFQVTAQQLPVNRKINWTHEKCFSVK